MASPKGQYTPRSGSLAGITFRSYFAYQQSRAQSLGFGSYSEQRRVMGISVVQTLRDRAMSVGDMTRTEATRAVSQWWRAQDYHGRSARPGAPHSGAQGLRKRAAIAWAVDNGLYDDGDDAAEEVPY
jgi:hypothetical protein